MWACCCWQNYCYFSNLRREDMQCRYCRAPLGEMQRGEHRTDVRHDHDHSRLLGIETEIPEYTLIDGTGLIQKGARHSPSQPMFGIDHLGRLVHFDRDQRGCARHQEALLRGQWPRRPNRHVASQSPCDFRGLNDAITLTICNHAA